MIDHNGSQIENNYIKITKQKFTINVTKKLTRQKQINEIHS